jgi:hypothetical protein
MSTFKIFLFLLSLPFTAFAGPPYDTDDPEPVEFRHWEFYSASHIINDDAGWNATVMHFEINYGVAPDLQLHAIVPFVLNSPAGAKSTYGLSDIELGTKYRLIHESKNVPMVGIFPLVELPTGNSSRGLGNGKPQLFLPVWLQKTFGKWTTYGGAGYMINFAENTKNNFFAGWQIQNQVAKNLSIGGEIYYKSPEETDGEHEVRFNLGLIFDINEHNHILFSAGRCIRGPVNTQIYLGYQITLGAEQ